MKKFWNAIKLENGKEYLLSIQHLFAMFGATILVPLITGFNVSAALVTAGIGTLIFHLITKGKVPVFLGSSFAFIGGITLVTLIDPSNAATVTQEGIQYAQGGIIIAGLIYCLLSTIIYFAGSDFIKKLFPPVVVGPVIVVIGMSLAPVGIGDALSSAPCPSWLSAIIALVVIVTVVFFNVTKLKNKFVGILKIIPILVGILVGYALCAILGACGVFEMDYSAFVKNDWFNIPYVSENLYGIKFFSLPKFSWTAVLAIAPIAFVTFMEHIGDITTNGAVVGKDFIKDPGLHRTLLGDGVATTVAGFLGGPCNTTYSENTGVLATTKNYNPKILRWTALFAILMGFFGKFGAALETIPVPVKGGVEIILYGMISAVGIKNLAESKVDMTDFRNIIVVALILVIGLGMPNIDIPIKGDITLTLTSLFVATVVGVIANAALNIRPEGKGKKSKRKNKKEEVNESEINKEDNVA